MAITDPAVTAAGRTARQLHRAGYRWTVTACRCSHGDVGMTVYPLTKTNAPVCDDDSRTYGYGADVDDTVTVVEPVMRRFIERYAPGAQLSRCGTNIFVGCPPVLARRFAAEITRLIGDGVIPPLRTTVSLPDGNVMQLDEIG